MKKIILNIIWFLILLNISNVYWCSCAWTSTPLGAYKNSEAIFIWKVVNIEEITETWEPNKNAWFISNLHLEHKYNIVTFTTSQNIKWSKEIYKIKTESKNSSCYSGFSKNREYFVYAYGTEEILSTDFCSRTRELIFAQEDIEAFESIKNNKFNYFILMFKVHKNFIYWMWIWIFFLFYWFAIYRIRKSKKLTLIKK